MRWLNGIIDSMDMSLLKSKLREIVKAGKPGMMQFMGLQRVGHNLVTKNNNKTELMYAHMLSHFSHVRLFATPWTVAHQAPLSMGFYRQEYWSGVPLSPPVIELGTSALSALAGGCFTTSATWEALS